VYASNTHAGTERQDKLEAPPEKPAYRFTGSLPNALDHLKLTHCWVMWSYIGKDGRWTKVPFNPRTGLPAKVSDPSTWGTFLEALAGMHKFHAAGVGIVLTPELGITGFDIDHCVTDSGSYSRLAAQVVALAETYIEISPSGKGLRGLARGAIDKALIAAGVEVYARGRYLTVTGDKLDDVPDEIRPAPQTLGLLKAAVAEARPHAKPVLPPSISGNGFFANVNGLALRRLDSWVPALHPTAKKQATGAWRVTSKGLGRDLEEDLSYHPDGIRDHGEECGLTPIDAVLKYGRQIDAVDAAMWLCRQMQLEPAALGWHGGAIEREGRRIELDDFDRRRRNERAPAPSFEIVWGIPPGEESQPWLTDSLMPEVGVGLLSGQWDTFKTFLGLDLAAAVLTGGTFMGRQVLRSGGVLWLAAEGQSQVPVRLQALKSKHGLDVGQFAWIKSCPLLMKPAAHDELRAIFLEAKKQYQERHGLPLTLAIIDTLGAAAGWKDENNTADAQAIMRMLLSLAREIGFCIVVVDHFGKIVDTGTRGASPKEDLSDFVIAVLGDRDLSGEVRNTRATVRKVRGATTGEIVLFSPSTVTLDSGSSSCVINWQEGQAPVKPPKNRWPKSLQVFRTALDNVLATDGQKIRPSPDTLELTAVDLDRVREEFYRLYILSEGGDEKNKQEARRKAFQRAVKEAQNNGLMGGTASGGKQLVWAVRDKT